MKEMIETITRHIDDDGACRGAVAEFAGFAVRNLQGETLAKALDLARYACNFLNEVHKSER